MACSGVMSTEDGGLAGGEYDARTLGNVSRSAHHLSPANRLPRHANLLTDTGPRASDRNPDSRRERALRCCGYLGVSCPFPVTASRRRRLLPAVPLPDPSSPIRACALLCSLVLDWGLTLPSTSEPRLTLPLHSHSSPRLAGARPIYAIPMPCQTETIGAGANRYLYPRISASAVTRRS